MLHLAIGIDVAVSPEVGLGPTIEYGHVFEEDGEGSSDDAAWVSIGATLTYRPPTSPILLAELGGGRRVPRSGTQTLPRNLDRPPRHRGGTGSHLRRRPPP